MNPEMFSPELKGADLQGESHRYLAVKNAVKNARVNGASVTDAGYIGANLTGANFSYANLTGANFTKTNLSGANFIGANLTGATLTEVKGVASV